MGSGASTIDRQLLPPPRQSPRRQQQQQQRQQPQPKQFVIDRQAYQAASGSSPTHEEQFSDDDGSDSSEEARNELRELGYSDAEIEKMYAEAEENESDDDDDDSDASSEEEEEEEQQRGRYDRIPREMPDFPAGNVWTADSNIDPLQHDGPYEVSDLSEADIWRILDQHAEREKEFLRTCQPVKDKRKERGKRFARLNKTKSAKDSLLRKKRGDALKSAIARGERRLREGALPWQAQQKKDTLHASIARRQAAWRKKQSKLRPGSARQPQVPVIRRMAGRSIVNRVPASVALAARRRSGLPGSAVLRPGRGRGFVEEQYQHLERSAPGWRARPQAMADPTRVFGVFQPPPRRPQSAARQRTVQQQGPLRRRLR